MQARHVLSDVIGGGSKVVQPPLMHVTHIAGSVPLAVAPCPRSDGGALESHDVLVLILLVPYMEEK